MKFSIRDLLLVTVIVAILVAWWVDRTRLANESEASKRQVSPLAASNAASVKKLSDQIDTVRAFEEALDETRPGWRNADGTYSIQTNSGHAWKIMFPPNSSAPAPNPPKP